MKLTITEVDEQAVVDPDVIRRTAGTDLTFIVTADFQAVDIIDDKQVEVAVLIEIGPTRTGRHFLSIEARQLCDITECSVPLILQH